MYLSGSIQDTAHSIHIYMSRQLLVIYCIAMSEFLTLSWLGCLSFLVLLVLHPHYKTTCVKCPQQWITDAKALATKVWTEKYKKVTL